MDAHKADPAVQTYEMEMPKSAKASTKKAEPLTSESLFDSVMTPMPAIPKLGDDLIAEAGTLAQAEKPNDQKEEKKESKP